MDTLVSILRSISLLPEQREHKPDCQVCFRRVFYAPVCGHHTSQVRPHKDLQHLRAHFDNHFQASASARLTSPAYGNKVIPQNEPHLQTRQTRYSDNSPTGRGVTASSSVSDLVIEGKLLREQDQTLTLTRTHNDPHNTNPIHNPHNDILYVCV